MGFLRARVVHSQNITRYRRNCGRQCNFGCCIIQIQPILPCAKLQDSGIILICSSCRLHSFPCSPQTVKSVAVVKRPHFATIHGASPNVETIHRHSTLGQGFPSKTLYRRVGEFRRPALAIPFQDRAGQRTRRRICLAPTGFDHFIRNARRIAGTYCSTQPASD